MKTLTLHNGVVVAWTWNPKRLQRTAITASNGTTPLALTKQLRHNEQ
jgi:hypothetical protein